MRGVMYLSAPCPWRKTSPLDRDEGDSLYYRNFVAVGIIHRHFNKEDEKETNDSGK